MAVIVVVVQAVVLYFPAAVPVLSGHENDDYDANGGDDSDDYDDGDDGDYGDDGDDGGDAYSQVAL